MAIVTSVLIYNLVRYRARGAEEPDQKTGSRALEVAWTAIPLFLVGLLFVFSARTTGAIFGQTPHTPDVIVRGHQWWWEIDYTSANFHTANELHIPTGRDILVAVESADVVHDFWAPRLGPKVDAIPGRRNITWIRADTPGIYRGFCAEFCGNQHAWMLFRVVAQNADDYGAWLAHEEQDAVQPQAGEAAAGGVRFRQLTCSNCHNINGINPQRQYGPDLTHVASRKMLAGERLENTRENMRDWLHEPNIIKPGCEMPNLKLSNTDLAALTAYLESLQ